MKDLRQYDQARDLLEDSIRLYPKNEAYYYDRSIFAVRDGNPREALKYLLKTADLVPYYGMGRKQLGMLYAQIGEFEKAAEELELAYRIYPSYHTDYVPLLVSAYIGANQSGQAVETIEKALLKEDIGPEILFAAGQAYLAAKDHAKAIDYLEQTLALRSAYPEARVLLGHTYVEAGEHEKALPLLEDARLKADSPHRFMLDSARIKAYVAAGRMEDARSLMTAVVARDPSARMRFLRDDKLREVQEFQPLLKP